MLRIDIPHCRLAYRRQTLHNALQTFCIIKGHGAACVIVFSKGQDAQITEHVSIIYPLHRIL